MPKATTAQVEYRRELVKLVPGNEANRFIRDATGVDVRFPSSNMGDAVVLAAEIIKRYSADLLGFEYAPSNYSFSFVDGDIAGCGPTKNSLPLALSVACCMMCFVENENAST